MQGEIFQKFNETYNLLLTQNLTPIKTASVMTLLEQMI